MKKNYKVDIIIPIYNSLEWLKICVKSIFKNTNLSIIGKVYLVDDCSPDSNVNIYLKEVKNKYGDLVEVIRNKKNLGFVKTCNKGMKISKSDYVLLLNTDCIVSKNAIEKIMNNMKKDKKIGLMCPIASVSANLSYPIPSGMNFMQINDIFGEQFLGKTFDACTVVGNCLMISRDCIEKVGYFDEIFGKGYTEETDYQFKAHKKGFKAKVTIDTYVYHQCRVSFGESEEQLKIREEHLKIFFDRWGKEYEIKYKKYTKNNPIDYINKNVSFNKANNQIEFTVTKKNSFEDLVLITNELVLNGINASIICTQNQIDQYGGIILFNPIIKKSIFHK